MKSRFSTAQIVEILSEATWGKSKAVARKHGISDKTISAWRRQYGGFSLQKSSQLRELQKENKRLKNASARLLLEVEGLREVCSKKW